MWFGDELVETNFDWVIHLRWACVIEGMLKYNN